LTYVPKKKHDSSNSCSSNENEDVEKVAPLLSVAASKGVAKMLLLPLPQGGHTKKPLLWHTKNLLKLLWHTKNPLQLLWHRKNPLCWQLLWHKKNQLRGQMLWHTKNVLSRAVGAKHDCLLIEEDHQNHTADVVEFNAEPKQTNVKKIKQSSSLLSDAKV
jgi:hypothetical protein